MNRIRHIFGRCIVLMVLLLTSVNARSANYYWVGGSGSWSDFSNHWATTSGGATFRLQVPTANDDVFFDANSFTASGQTINGDNTVIFFHNMDWTGVTNNPQFLQSTASSTINVFGSLTLIPGMNWNVSGSVLFLSNSTGNTITSAGQTYKNRVDFEGSGGGWTLQDAMTLNGAASATNSGLITLDFGTLNTNAKAVTCLGFLSSNSNVRSLIMDNTAFTINYNNGNFTAWNTQSVSNYTFSATGSTITIAGTYPYTSFASNSKTYNNLYFTYTGGIQQSIQGSGNTFNGTVTFSGICINTGGNTFNGNLNFNNTGSIGGGTSTCNGTTNFLGDGSFTSANTFNGAVNLATGKTYLFQSGITQTISATGALNAVGTCTQPITLKSSTNGVQATISKIGGNLNADQTIIQDLKATVSAGFAANATNSFDGGNNTNWIFPAFAGPAMYWIGGNGNWNDPAHWSFTSGGSAGSCIPGPGNDVFFDGNSFTNASKTVTMNASTASCKSMSWTGAGFTPTFTTSSSANTLKIYGSLTLISAMNLNYNGYLSFEANTTGNTITSAGKTWPANQMYFNGVGGSWSFQDAFSTNNVISLVNGTLNTNNQAVSCYYFESQYNSLRTLNLGSSTWLCTGYYWLISGGNMTLNAGTSTIRVTYSGFSYFYGGNLTYNNVSLESVTGPNSIQYSNVFNGAVTILGDCDFGSSNTFNGTLTLTAGKTYALGAGQTQTIGATGSLIANGTCGNYINITSNSAGNQATITKINGNLIVDNTVLKDIKAILSVGYQANATNKSTDLGNNTNWNFSINAGTNLYWVGGAGNWGDANHWSLTSGGTPGACVPGPTDNVNFDANSFTNISKTVTVNVTNALCKNMNWTGAAFTPSFNYGVSGKLRIFGSLTLISAMNFNYGGQINFESGSAGNTITTAGKNMNGTVYFIGGSSGSWSLQDAFTTSNYMELTSGTLNTNNQTVTCLYFGSNSGQPRALNLGSSMFNLTNYYWNVGSSNFAFNAGTSTIHLLNQYSGAGSIYPLYAGGLTYYNVTIESGVNPGTVQGTGIFNGVVTFVGAGQIEGNNTFNGDVVFNADGRINQSNTFNGQLKFTSGQTYTVASGVTQTFSSTGSLSFIAVGSPCAPIAISSSVNGSITTFFKASGEVCADYLYLNSVKATGGATWSAGLHSTNTTPATGTGWQNIACSSPLQSAIISASGPLCGSGSITLSSRTAASYLWSTGATTQSIVISTAGTYSLSIVNLNGCSESGSLTIVSASVPACSISGATSTCPSALETYTGPAGMAGYAWSISGPGSIPGSAIGSSVGVTPTSCGAYTISVGVKNAAGCVSTCSTITAVVDVTPPTISCPANISTLNATGLCGKNVSFSVTGADNCGTPTIVSTPASGSFFTQGTTTVNSVATDACGNTAPCSFTVTINTNALTVSATPTNVSCNSANGGNHSNGKISTTVAGGSGTYSYSWTGGASGANPTGLAAGTYTVTVSDGGCSTPVTAVVTIAEPTAISYTSVTATDIRCNNSNGGTHNNGTATVNGATGGTGSLSYLWSNGATSNPATGLTGTTTYNVTIKDANSCTATGSATVGQPAAVTASSTNSSIQCNGGTSVVTVSATGGVSPYSGDGAQSPVYAGGYSYTVTDASGCSASTSGTINEPTLLTASSTSGSVACNGGTTTVTVSGSGGTAPYTGDGTFTVSAGTYTYTVTDANLCTATTTITVADATAVVASSTTTDVLCNGGSTGTVTVSATGGAGGYTGSIGTFSGLAAGPYSYTIADANGCSATTTGSVNEPTAVVASSTTTDVLCNGGSTGTVTVSATGGVGGYTGSMGTFSGLAAGPYSYTIADANGCPATTTGTVNEPTAVVASSTTTDVLCNGGNTGTVTVSATGGVGGYTGSMGAFSGLAAGPYSYTIADANSCPATTTGTVNEPTLLTASSISGSVACNGGTTTVTVSGSGGTAPYSGAGTFTVGAGTYTYTVTDVNLCTATTTITVTEPTAVVASSTTTDVLCNGGSTGTVTVSATGGVGGYTGVTTYTGLGAGSYTYSVSDANHCSATTTGAVNEPTAVVASSTTTDALCNGGSTGTVTVSATGGVGGYTGVTTYAGLAAGPYTYSVSDANHCPASTSGNVNEPTAVVASSTTTDVLCNGGSTGTVTVSATGGVGGYTGSMGTFSGLAAGPYSYTIADANGCPATTTGTVSEPTAVAASSSSTPVLCNGGSTGAVTVSATGGVGSYTGTGTFAGKAAGTYTYTVADANGCSSATTVAVTEPTAVVASSSFTPVLCNGGSTGTVTVSATGGVGGYTGAGTFTGKSAGTYTYTVADANSCSASTTVTVTEPTKVVASSTFTPVLCNGGTTGTVTVSATGGVGGYTGTGAFTGKSAGTYTYTVADANGCTASTTVTVTEPTALSASAGATPVYPVSGYAAYTIYLGYGAQTETLSETVTGGTPGYTYSWSPATGSTSTLAVSPVSTTTYSVTVTDANGCKISSTKTIYVIDVTCCAGKSGMCEKVNVCHGGKTLCVAASAVPAHLAHGDVLGACGGGKGNATGNNAADNDETAGDAIKVYPNPTTGIFSIEIPVAHKAAEIQVLDMTGRVIEKRYVSDNDGHAIPFSLLNTARGIYMVKVTADDVVYIAKLIVD